MGRGLDIDRSPSLREREIQTREQPRSRPKDFPDRNTQARSRRGREPLRGRDTLIGILDLERERLLDVGRFRTLDARDLKLKKSRLKKLQEEGIVQTRSVRTASGKTIQAVSLTKYARRRLERALENPQQRLHSGLTDSRQQEHDTTLYRLYQQGAEKIQKNGGTIQRVVLDHELKRKVLSDLNRNKARSKSDSQNRRDVASWHDLKVVDGKIPIPDVRIEYLTRHGREKRVDLELATDQYRPGQLAMKSEAGFKIYAMSSGSSGGGSGSGRKHLREVLPR